MSKQKLTIKKRSVADLAASSSGAIHSLSLLTSSTGMAFHILPPIMQLVFFYVDLRLCIGMQF